MEIKLTCSCGASCSFTDSSGTMFVVGKVEGLPEAIFPGFIVPIQSEAKPLIELMADRWLQNHICNDRPVKLE